MTKVDPIIELHPWLALPSGRDVLALEQLEMDRLVSDRFGFHALQLGLPEIDALRANRMRHRWLALDAAYDDWIPSFSHTMADTSPPATEGPPTTSHADQHGDLRCDFESLPFPNNSLDLVVLPHALELAMDPHHTLREVARVLVPEGRVVIAVFNPISLWGLWQRMGQWGVKSALVLPQGEFIGLRRLKDWLHLLDLEVESATFTGYRPLLRDPVWWARLAWMERLGHRWWPHLGSVYFVVAVKRVRGMRLVGKIKPGRIKRQAAPAVVTSQHVSKPMNQDMKPDGVPDPR
jgi:SAM-dependent methyltransferase